MKIDCQIVEAALQAEDPEGFLRLGAPRDEYSGEAQRIASADIPEPTTENIVVVIREAWMCAFGPFSEEEMRARMPGLMRVARAIAAEVKAGREKKDQPAPPSPKGPNETS